MTTAQENPNGPTVSPPPCPAEISQHENPSKDQINNFNHTRCQFTYSDGRRCANERAYLCAHHGSRPRDRSADSAALDAPEPPIRSGSASRATNESEGSLASIEPLCSDLTNATSINRALTQVVLLMAQGRISQKQAVAFGYITQLLLQTLPGVRAEFVSVYDPNRWRAKLQANLESLEDDADEGYSDDFDDGRPAATHPGPVILSESASADDRRISHTGLAKREKPASVPVNRSEVTQAPQSAHSNPQNAHAAEVITLVPRGSPPQAPSSQRDHPARSSGESHQQDELSPAKRVIPSERLERGTSQSPPLSPAPRRLARDFYGNPIPPADAWLSLPGAAAVIERASQSDHPTRSSGESHQQDEVSPAKRVIPSEQRERGTPPNPPSRDAVIPNEGTPPKDNEGKSALSRASGNQTHASSSSNPHSDKRNAHTTAWFAPASWSGRQKPDPYPSGTGKLRRKFNSIANSAFRKVQHQNSRGFWSPGMKHLTT